MYVITTFTQLSFNFCVAINLYYYYFNYYYYYYHIQVRIYFLQAAGVAGYSEIIRNIIGEDDMRLIG
jgi:hypothetical protein